MRSTDLRIKQKPGVLKLLALVFWMAVWEIAALLIDNSLVLPTPFTTLKVMGNLLKEDAFIITVITTVVRVFGGVAFSVSLGIVAGFISARSMGLRVILEPFVTVIRTLPVVSISILLNLWIQSGWVPIAVTFCVCFPIAFTNIIEGVDNTDRKLLEMAQVYQVSKQRVLKDIYVPSLKSYGAAALISSVGMGWKATVTAEVLANALPSMGMELYYSKIYLETETLFAWTLVVVVLSFLIEKAVVQGMKKVKAGDGNEH